MTSRTETYQYRFETPHLVLHCSKSQCQEAQEDLAVILTLFSDSEDPLSKRIFKWGAKALSVNPDSIEPIDELKFYQHVMKRVDKLYSRILVDSLTFAPLKDPYIDGQWIWDKAILDDYMTLGQPCPFDQKPMQPIPHRFAKEMVQWLDRLNMVKKEEPQASSATDLIEQTNEPSLKRMLYGCLVNHAQRVHEEIAARKKLKEELASFTKELRDELKRLVAEELRKAREDLKTHKRDVDQKLDDLEETHQTEADELKAKLQEATDSAEQLERNLRDQEEITDQLRSRIGNLRAEYQKRVQEIQEARSGGGGGGFCVLL